MSSSGPQSAPRRARRGCLLTAVVVAVVVIVSVIVLWKHAFLYLWDGWQDLRVVGRVLAADATPVGGARVTLVLHPGSRGYHLGLTSVRRPDSPWGGRSFGREEDPAVEHVSGRVGVVHADPDGRIDFLLHIWSGGSSGEDDPPPPFGGVYLVIVEADGFVPAYVDMSPRRWSFDESDAYDDLGTLDLGAITLSRAGSAQD